MGERSGGSRPTSGAAWARTLGPMTQPVQRPSDGSGSLLVRRYWVDIQDPALSAAELMRHIQLHLPAYAPSLLADFEKSQGSAGALRPGDEFRIRILGPWNGSVRVGDVQEDHFEMLTLEGHPEAGRIRFALTPHADFAGALHFEIRSLARSRDGLVAFAYDTVGIGKKVQETTWVSFCEEVVARSGGRALGDVQVRTLREEDFAAEADPEQAVREAYASPTPDRSAP